MKASRTITLTAAALLIVCLLGSVLFLRRVDEVRTGATLEEVIYITSPKALKRLAIGYDGLLADIYWTRAIQYFGRHHFLQSGRYDLLAQLLEITTTLDPHLIVAYEFGANFVAPAAPNGAGMPDRAIRLLEFGIQQNPSEPKLYYSLGFIYYMELKDYPKAADTFQKGSELPGSHPFMKVLAAQAAQHAGESQTARMLWVLTYKTIPEKDVRANALAHLEALQVDDEIRRVEDAVTLYGRKTGKLPASMGALVAAGLLPKIPMDPDGHPFKLLPDGRVEVQNPDSFPFIQKGLPPDYTAKPSKLEKFYAMQQQIESH
jgi:tetratricopeptide (TPR) repeat protein